MSVVVIVPLLVCFTGLVAFVAASNTKISELGRMSFFAGLLVTLAEVANHVIRF